MVASEPSRSASAAASRNSSRSTRTLSVRSRTDPPLDSISSSAANARSGSSARRTVETATSRRFPVRPELSSGHNASTSCSRWIGTPRRATNTINSWRALREDHVASRPSALRTSSPPSTLTVGCWLAATAGTAASPGSSMSNRSRSRRARSAKPSSPNCCAVLSASNRTLVAWSRSPTSRERLCEVELRFDEPRSGSETTRHVDTTLQEVQSLVVVPEGAGDQPEQPRHGAPHGRAHPDRDDPVRVGQQPVAHVGHQRSIADVHRGLAGRGHRQQPVLTLDNVVERREQRQRTPRRIEAPVP